MQNRTDRYNPFFRQLLFLGVLVAMGVVIFRQLNFFVGAFLGATTLYVVLRNSLFRLTEERHWKPWIASSVLVAMTCIVLLCIGYVIFEVVASEIPQVDTARVVGSFNKLIARVNDWIGYQVISGKLLTESQHLITRFASMLINTTYSFAANIFLMVVLLYFMLAAGRRMEDTLLRYAPFSGRSLKRIKREAKDMIFSNAVGIPVVMVAQAAASALFYWIAGIPNVLFWAFVTGVFGLVPMLGTAIVTVPLSIYLLATGAVWQGIVLLAAAVIIIANVDNACRIFLMKRAADTHPMIVILGVILGIPLFGFWGIIFGPLLISGFLLLIRIYYIEYRLTAPLSSDQNIQNREQRETNREAE
ncbi:AI-2E family transporter [uncultured Rikenella sp.]|uniref:AI-2E family transporter n=1 Tax=uncultured Rikenella sp. TaxID=368003 RepID=UPI00261377EF|nr:AI-2E family transporter [uncultured Rikenella sp.]